MTKRIKSTSVRMAAFSGSPGNFSNCGCICIIFNQVCFFEMLISLVVNSLLYIGASSSSNFLFIYISLNIYEYFDMSVWNSFLEMCFCNHKLCPFMTFLIFWSQIPKIVFLKVKKNQQVIKIQLLNSFTLSSLHLTSLVHREWINYLFITKYI